ncbi:MAG: S8 family serine peptidase, partial [Gammaproteobacteria bacterium]
DYPTAHISTATITANVTLAHGANPRDREYAATITVTPGGTYTISAAEDDDFYIPALVSESTPTETVNSTTIEIVSVVSLQTVSVTETATVTTTMTTTVPAAGVLIVTLDTDGGLAAAVSPGTFSEADAVFNLALSGLTLGSITITADFGGGTHTITATITQYVVTTGVSVAVVTVYDEYEHPTATITAVATTTMTVVSRTDTVTETIIITTTEIASVTLTSFSGGTAAFYNNARFAYAVLPPPNPSDGVNYRNTEFTVNYGLGQIKADAAYRRGYWGQGVTVGIVDSGMLTSHVDLRDRVVPGYNFARGNSVITDPLHFDNNRYGHGTGVAGVVGASRNSLGVHGVAPSVALMPLQLGGADGRLTGNPVSAFRFAVSSGVHILNNSYGPGDNHLRGTYRGRQYWAPIPLFAPFFSSGEIARAGVVATIAANADAVWVWSAGNNGWRSGGGRWVCESNPDDFDGDCPLGDIDVLSISQLLADFDIACEPGQPVCGRLGTLSVTVSGSGEVLGVPESGSDGYNLYPHYFPQLTDSWLAVVATREPAFPGDTSRPLASFSNGCGDAKFWCIAAPGSSIYTTGGASNSTVVILGGTSFSAPHVSGALAVLKSRLTAMPMAVVRALLLVSADDLGDEGVDSEYGWGFVNLERAVTLQNSVWLVAPDSSGEDEDENEDGNAESANTLSLDLPPPNDIISSPVSYRTTEFGRNYGLSQIGAEYAYSRDYFGQGATVGIVDTGMLTSHLDLRDNVVAGYDFFVNTPVIDEPRSSYNEFGYGTAAGGIVAAARNNLPNSAHGVAPQAKLMPLQLGDRLGLLSGNPASAFTWARINGAHVVNNGYERIRHLVGTYQGVKYHLRAPAFPELYDESDRAFIANQGVPYLAALQNDDGTRADMVAVWSAGDRGWRNGGGVELCADTNNNSLIGVRDGCPEEMRITLTPQQVIDGFVSEGYTATITATLTRFVAGFPFEQVITDTLTLDNIGALSTLQVPTVGVGFFARMPFDEPELMHQWLAVAATGEDDPATAEDEGEELASFSNGCGDAKFWCLAAPGENIYTTSGTGDGDYGMYSGTAFAAAHASGALAVLKSRLSSMPMAAVRAVLLHTAEDIGDTGIDDEFGWGLVDLEKAITLQGSVRIVLDNDSRGGGGAESRRGRAGDGRADSFAVRFCFGAGGVGGNIGGGFGVWKRALQYAFGGVGGGVFFRAYYFGKCGGGHVFAFARQSFRGGIFVCGDG